MAFDPSLYLALAPSGVRYGVPLKIDLYLYLPNNQHLMLFRKKGDTLVDADRAKISQVQGCQLLVLKNDFSAATVAASSAITDEFLKNGKVTEKVSEQAGDLLNQAGSPEMMSQLPNAVEEILSQLKATVPSLKTYDHLLKEMSKDPDPLTAHHRQVSAIATLILITVGQPSMEEMSDIATAGLIHDVGLMGGPKTLLEKYLKGQSAGFNNTEKLLYMKHPAMAREWAEKTRMGLQAGALKILEFHHENFDGTGFHGLAGPKIYYAAKVLRIADEAVRKMETGECAAFNITLGLLLGENEKQAIFDPKILATLAQKLFQGMEAS